MGKVITEPFSCIAKNRFNCQYEGCVSHNKCIMSHFSASHNMPKRLIKAIRTANNEVGVRDVANPVISIRREVYTRDGYKCLKCGTKEHLTLDEVVPRAKGGKRSIENCQTLCYPCNREKGTNVIDYRNG